MKVFNFLLLAVGFIALAPSGFGKEGGEIGNAFIPFESRISSYTLEYPAGWQQFDLSQMHTFTEAAPAAGKDPSFFSVLSDRFPGLLSKEDLGRHLKFFSPDKNWQPLVLAGLQGFSAWDGNVRVIYLLRGPEDIFSLRLASTDGERTDALLSHMLGSFRVY